MEVMQIANSFPMWIACGVPVLLVVVQAALFARDSFTAGKAMGLTDIQLKSAARSSAITSIGPSIVILSGMLSLLVMLGGPVAWMRLSMIGSVMFESLAAGIGTQTVGVTLGSDPLTPLAFTMALWTMVLGSIGWVIFATFSADRMSVIEQKVSKGNTVIMTTIASAAIIGVFSAQSAASLIRLNKNAVACILGGLIMAVITFIAEKKDSHHLREWSLTITILLAMIITALL